MGRVGSALDNAAAEAFNSTVKVEYIHRHRFTTRTEARLKISTWIVDFYNLHRRHSACDGMLSRCRSSCRRIVDADVPRRSSSISLRVP